MKHLKILLIVIVLFVLGGIAWAATWEGPLNPEGFNNWKEGDPKHQVNYQNWYAIILKNQNKDHKIKGVRLVLSYSGKILGYGFFLNDSYHVYVLDPLRDRYRLYKITVLTDESMKGCMKCHAERLKKKVFSNPPIRVPLK